MSDKMTCVQCKRELTHRGDLKWDVAPSVCIYSDCPNYGLLAIALEKMPHEQNST